MTPEEMREHIRKNAKVVRQKGESKLFPIPDDFPIMEPVFFLAELVEEDGVHCVFKKDCAVTPEKSAEPKPSCDRCPSETPEYLLQSHDAEPLWLCKECWGLVARARSPGAYTLPEEWWRQFIAGRPQRD